MKDKLELKILSVIIATIILSIIAASATVLYVQYTDMFALATKRLEGTANVITSGIEHAMLDADAGVAKSLVKDLHRIEGFESIEVFNHQGSPAFSPGAPTVEVDAINRLKTTQKHFVEQKTDSIVFYMPLLAKQQCYDCHRSEDKVLGAVKISMSMKSERDKAVRFITMIVLGSILVIIFMSGIFAKVLRKTVIKPVKSLEGEAAKMADGDLSFQTDITTTDEIGRLDRSIKESLMSLSGILRRVRDVSGRVENASRSVQADSDRIVEGTQLEAEAVADMSSSIEELNSAIVEISDSTETLATSVEQSASSVEEMAASIAAVTKITHELTGGIDETSSSIGEMSSAIKEIANNAEELASVSEETLSAVNQIISSIREVESNARESARLSEKVAEDASTLGVSSVNKTMEGMKKIEATVERTAEAVHRFAERSEEIGSITDVIDGITDQTTLLALNAAIIAAQAGEHGKGFSVVAAEIKDLAERTAFSTQEISKLVQDVRAEIREAVRSMAEGLTAVKEGIGLSKEAERALKQILESASKSSEMVNSIKRSTAEQSAAAKSVSESIERVRSMVEQIARSTAEQSEGVTLIMKASDSMRDGAHQVDIATQQQAAGSRQISKAVEIVSDRTQEISRAIYEQKIGSKQIWAAIEKMKNIPKENRDIAVRINNMIQDLHRDSQLLSSEMQRLKLREDDQQAVVRIGVVPHESPAEMHKKYAPLIDYLGARLGKRVEMKMVPEYTTAIRELGAGSTQMCFLGPVSYIEAAKSAGAEPLVGLLRSGKPYHRALIIAKLGSGISSLSDLKGRSFAFGNAHSTTGHIVPSIMLRDAGIELGDFSSYRYLGSHEEVLKAVLKGDFDAGAVMESAAEGYKGVQVVKASVQVPDYTLCVTSAMPQEERDAVKAALLQLNVQSPQGSEILGELCRDCTGFQEASDSDFDEIRQMLFKNNQSK